MNPCRFTFPSLVMAAAVLAAGGSLTGCGKQDASTTSSVPPTAPAPPSGSATVERAVATAEAQTEVVKRRAEGVVTNVQAQAADAVKSEAQPAVDKVQQLIEQTKTLVSESKWTEALALLNQLSGQNLSAEQQSLVQGLKEKAQKAMQGAAAAKASDQATKAVGGTLQK